MADECSACESAVEEVALEELFGAAWAPVAGPARCPCVLQTLLLCRRLL